MALLNNFFFFITWKVFDDLTSISCTECVLRIWHNTYHTKCYFCFLSGGWRGKKLLKLEQVEAIIKFILNFAAENCILLRGRIAGVGEVSRRQAAANLYSKGFDTSGGCIERDSRAPDHGVVAQSTFRKLWRNILPYVVSAKPATDLCC